MNVLVACEESQVVCSCFRSFGLDAFSCDLVFCSGGHPEWHIKSDVRNVLSFPCSFFTCDGSFHSDIIWDLVIAHPPCTFLSKAGARWLYPKAGLVDSLRYEKGLAAKAFFDIFFDLPCRVAIENPTPLKIFNLPSPSQVIQPYMFGDPFSKRTLLWLKNLPNLVPTCVLSDFKPFVPSNTGGVSRGQSHCSGSAFTPRDRSRSFPGIAYAMASQWSYFLSDCI